MNVTANEGISLSKSWLLDDEVITTDTLSLHTDPINKVRDYEFRVQDKYGNESSVYFNVYVENHLKAYPDGEDEGTDSTNVYVESGQSAELKACVSADNMEDLTYRWDIQITDSDGHKRFGDVDGTPGLTLKTSQVIDGKTYVFNSSGVWIK